MGDVVKNSHPKPFQLDLNGDIEDISMDKDAPVGDSYQNPFARIDPFAKSAVSKSHISLKFKRF